MVDIEDISTCLIKWISHFQYITLSQYVSSLGCFNVNAACFNWWSMTDTNFTFFSQFLHWDCHALAVQIQGFHFISIWSLVFSRECQLLCLNDARHLKWSIPFASFQLYNGKQIQTSASLCPLHLNTVNHYKYNIATIGIVPVTCFTPSQCELISIFIFSSV